jgi:hypothetical protein
VFPVRYEHPLHIESKAIPISGREGPYRDKKSSIPQFVERRIKYDGEFVSFTCRPCFIPRRFLAAILRPDGFSKLKKKINNYRK